MSRWSDTALRRLAWAAWWLAVLAGGSRVVVTAVEPTPHSSAWGGGQISAIDLFVVGLAFSLVGLVVLRRNPRTTVGWLLQAAGLSSSLPAVLWSYAHHGLVIDPGSVPGPEVAAALYEGMWTTTVGAVGVFVVLFFPDGRLPSPRWRPVAWAAGLAVVTATIVIDLSPGRLEEAPVRGLQNPLGVEWAGPVLTAAAPPALLLLTACVVAGAASLVIRYRTTHGVARQQIKWLATAGSLVALLFATSVVLALPSEVSDRDGVSGPDWVALVQEASFLAYALLPLAIGIAILRYRLFDIDLVINRALVYGSLTVALAALYLGSVLVLQSALQPFTDQSDLAVAASTLAVAALFRPLRSRIQRLVDRRFYRARYDAARTLETFAVHLRDDVDLESLRHDLRGVVLDTVQPTQVSLWLRGAAP